jgi:hypothetical protein
VTPEIGLRETTKMTITLLTLLAGMLLGWLHIKKRQPADDDGKVVDAVLILDNTNPKDKSAVRVDVQGQTVGYLSPDLAKTYRRRLQEGAYLNVRGICKAKITSRMYRSIGADYVIRLDLPDKK